MGRIHGNFNRIEKVNTLRRYTLLVILLLMLNCLKAEDFNPSIRWYSVNEGLHDNNIVDVLQDSYGFLWLAGIGGLQKYDGYTFTHYNTDSINQAWQQAERLFEDSNKNLWIQLKEGLVRYNRELDIFIKYHFTVSNGDTIPYTISAMAEDLDGVVWFWVQDKGLFTVDNGKSSFIPNNIIKNWYKKNSDVIVRNIVFDKENQLWIGSHFKGLIRINPETGKFKNYEPDPETSGGLSNRRITQSYRDKNGDLWFATRRGLNKFDDKRDLFERFYMVSTQWWNELNNIDRIAEDDFGNIWTVSGTVKGFSCFNKKSKKFIHYSQDLNPWLSSVTVDKSGIIWISCFYQGVLKIDPHVGKFSSFSLERDGKDVLQGRLILAVLKDQYGKIWFGGDLDGLYSFNPESGKNRLYKLNRTDADSNNSNYILDIFQDDAGILWIGTKTGLIRFDTKTGIFKHINPGSSIYEGMGRTASILQDWNNNLWLITINGILVHYNHLTQETEFYNISDKQLSFRAFIADSQGFLWIGTLKNGLFKFNVTTKEFSQVKEISNGIITSLCFEGDSILWCGSNGNGLIRYNTSTKIKTEIGEKQGLLSNGILGLEIDKSGNLWMSTQQGLCKYNPRKHIINSYFKEDGFLTNEFTYRAHAKDTNGEIIFGSTHGVVTFNPDSIVQSMFNPPITLTDFKIHNKRIIPGKDAPLKKHISQSDEVVLKHDQNNLSISFSSLDLTHPHRNEYSFYLQNLETDWRTPGWERTAYYTNIDPGEYIFKVKGTNSDGIWNEEGTSLKIIVLPPWYKSVWAYNVYGLIFLFGFYIIRRYELSRQKLKHKWELKQLEAEKLQEIDKVKSRFFANISHEFRTPLTLILGPVEELMRNNTELNGVKSEPLNLIHKNASRLWSLINQLLDLSKLETGNMKLSVVEGNLTEFIRTIALSFMSLAESRNINYKIELKEQEQKIYFDLDKVEKIVINLLSNAFKFTPENGTIIIRMEYKSEISINDQTFAKISVTDSGIGIPEELHSEIFNRFFQANSSNSKDFEGTGIGLSLIKELIDIYRGKIELESEQGKGSCFNAYLPASRELFRVEEINSAKGQNKEFPSKIIGNGNWIKTNVPLENNDEESKFRNAGTVILVVEDNKDLQKYIKQQLLNYAHVLLANNGREGFEKSVELIPDLVITDLMMPEMDGIELCSRIKEDERTSHIPVIMLTAKADQQSKLEGLKKGADDYLIKPFNSEELKIRVKNLIDLRNKLKEKYSRAFFAIGNHGDLSSADERFLKKATEVIRNHISEDEFTVEEFCKVLGVSNSQLNRKLNAMVGLSPSLFIRNLRLKQSAILLENGYDNVSQIAYEVGFSDHSYFTKCFRELYGVTPTRFMTQKKIR